MHEEFERRLSAIEEEIPSVRAALETNTQITQLTKADTAQLLEFIETIRVVQRLGHWISNFIRWIAPPIAAIAAVWALMLGRGHGK